MTANNNALLAPPTPNLGASYLTTTVVNTMVEGQIRAGFVIANAPAADNEDEGEKGKPKKEKYILRHLASGRIMYVSTDSTRVELESF